MYNFINVQKKNSNHTYSRHKANLDLREKGLSLGIILELVVLVYFQLISIKP